MEGLFMATDPKQVKAEADIKAVFARIDEYQQALNTEYGQLRVRAVMYDRLLAENRALLALLREYRLFCEGDLQAVAQHAQEHPTSVTARMVNDWNQRRDQLQEQGNEWFSEEPH